MHPGQLKRIRVGVSLTFFVLTLLLFLDFRNLFAHVSSNIILYPQFVPSFLKFLSSVTLGASGFVMVLMLTLFLGRIYCSSICPLGTMQDGFSYLSRKMKKRSVHYRLPQNILRYSIFALTIFVCVSGSNLVLNLLDPFSSFGRIVTNIVRPFGIIINNGGAMILEKFGVYALVREHWAVMAPLSTGISLTMLLFLIWMSSANGRLYCNSICPVGTLLGLVSRFSFLKLKVDETSCTNCRRCAAVCKASCIDLDEGTIDMSRCVSCYNCLAVCKTDSIGFVRRTRCIPESGNSTAHPERREFLLHSGACLFTLTSLTESASPSVSTRQIKQAKPTSIPEERTNPVSPPGSISIEHFTKRCTACHLCVSACPPQILLPSVFEYGVSGLMQPRMYFEQGHCNYECTLCGEVCPSGAILPLTLEQKKLTQTGVAQFIRENCVVYTDNTDCGACSEHCPTKAVNMIPYDNLLGRNLVIPDVKPELCVGCGGCEHACPTRPYKAIFVDGNPKHKRAEKPVVQKVEQDIDYQEDFPFDTCQDSPEYSPVVE